MEMAVPEAVIRERMCWEKPVLSCNHKCSISLDLPVLNCRPTKACAEVCYASQGRQIYRRALVKSLAVNRIVLNQTEMEILVRSG